MIRKLFALFLSTVLIFGMLGCGSSKSDEPSNASKNTAAEDNQTEDKQVEDSQAEDNQDNAEDAAKSDSNTDSDNKSAEESNDLTIDNTVIFDQDGFKVTAISFGEDGYGGYELKTSVENNSDKNVTFQVDDVSVNGYMNTPLYSVDVTAGNKAEDTISFYIDTLIEGGIKEITSIEFKVLVLDSETFDTIASSDIVTLSTGLTDAGTYDTTGESVYDDQGIKVTAQYLYTDDIFGEELIFYIENNSDKNIFVQNSSVSINGTMADALLYCEVLPGKKAVTEMTFSGLADSGITEITDTEFSLNISNTDTFETIAETETVTLSFE